MKPENQSNSINNESNTTKKEKTTIKCKKIGNFVLAKTIGKGAFSKVKVGIHLPTNLKVAIKILDKSKIKDKKDSERISREIQILKKLRHKNIVQLYQTISSNKNIYLIMEYANGEDLFTYIKKNKRLDEKRTSIIFQQLICSIEYIHKLGIVHRDIKPENILIDENNISIKLVDFGLSNMYIQGDLLKTACGSPCYAAPEVNLINSHILLTVIFYIKFLYL
jgi:5'-AMP-activated protein kinase catalytic alpha subunit